jgi:hypothetical protein
LILYSCLFTTYLLEYPFEDETVKSFDCEMVLIFCLAKLNCCFANGADVVKKLIIYKGF